MNVTVNTMEEFPVWWVRFNDPTPKGERLLVEIAICSADPKDKQCLPYVAKKLGWSDKLLSTWWGVQTYITDAEGNQWGDLYNPTITREVYEYLGDGMEPETRYRSVQDFDWWLEATEDNAKKILEEIERRAYAL